MHELDAPFPLPAGAVTDFRARGFVRLKQVLSPELLMRYRSDLTRIVREKDGNAIPLEERDTYGRAFTQIFNLWREDSEAERLMRSQRLARIATELLGVTGVRLYHDQALYKEPRGGHTPWHCDQFYWPLSSDRTVTVWIPLQPVPMHVGPLAFAAGSHNLDNGRNLAISDDSEAHLARVLEGYEVIDEPFELGEVSFHAGWTYHRAGPNQSNDVRAVFTIIYMDKDMRLVEPTSNERRFDAEMWCPGVKVGEIIDSPINPVLYSRE
ncbi:MAG TPA: phytanoyl-CoA dioxygenase [Chloroflexi bacterium]|jgi:ectoine hydroxylase-related dioxygenase (phytanoyl-CoA dioxygenase family)|nr:phytanoyl-CoA dioxygenase [Chloroflexota bacterium]